MPDERTPVGTAIDQRRRTLRYTWTELSSASRISHQTMRNLRNGDSVYEDTERNVERALGWSPGSIDRVRRTGDPTAATLDETPPLLPPEPPPGIEATDGAEWLSHTVVAGGTGIRWTLTRIIDGAEAAVTVVDFSGADETRMHADLKEVMNENEIRKHRRLSNNSK